MAKVKQFPQIINGLPYYRRGNYYIVLNPVDDHELEAAQELGIPVKLLTQYPELEDVVSHLFRWEQLPYSTGPNKAEPRAVVGPFPDDHDGQELKEKISTRGQRRRTFLSPRRDVEPKDPAERPYWEKRQRELPTVEPNILSRVRYLVQRYRLTS